MDQFTCYDRFRRGLPYDVYLERMHRIVEAGDEGLNETARNRYGYTRLNEHRTRRVHRTYRVPDDLRALVEAIDEPQVWGVLTEAWCGDSAQTIPYVAEVAALNPLIDLRMLLRDEHPDVMDVYVTPDGRRSIPVLVVFGADGTERFRWGPRPAEADALFRAGRAEGLPKPEIDQRLHLWYGRDRGRTVERELKTHLERMVPAGRDLLV